MCLVYVGFAEPSRSFRRSTAWPSKVEVGAIVIEDDELTRSSLGRHSGRPADGTRTY